MDTDDQRICSFPWTFDAASGTLTTIDATRDEISGAGFLDMRAGLSGEQRTVALQQIETHPPTRPPAWIFHTGFCCSTLISRCLDHPGKALALKEPQILIDLSGAYRQLGDDQSFTDAFGKVSHLLAAPFDGDERAIIKPSNGANNLLGPALEYTPPASVLLLYSDLRSFLISVLKRGLTGAQFVRSLAQHPWGATPTFARFFTDNATKLTDLQVAAMIWHLQMAAFAKVASNYPARVRTLDAAHFQRNPKTVLSAIDEFFELGLGATHIDNVIAEPLFSENAKNTGAAFNATTNAAARAAIDENYGGGLDAVIQWSQTLPFAAPTTLPSPLIT